jgi:hypothetical protein
MTSTPLLPRLGPATGAVFAVALTIAAGNGNTGFSAPRAIAGMAALTLALPFLSYLSSLLRQAEGANGWLATTALAAGVAGITLKIASVAPEVAIHQEHIADGTRLHSVLEGIGNGGTLLSLYPLAGLCAAVAAVALRTQVLPRWLAIGAAVTAVALVVNGGFVGTDFVPALLLFILWTLVASIYLTVRAQRSGAPLVEAGVHAA